MGSTTTGSGTITRRVTVFPSSDCGLCGISSILSHDEMQSAADRTLRTKNDMQVLLLMARYLKIQVSLHRHTIRER